MKQEKPKRMINKRNVEVRFDATAFNNIQKKNSKWITENGK